MSIVYNFFFPMYNYLQWDLSTIYNSNMLKMVNLQLKIKGTLIILFCLVMYNNGLYHSCHIDRIKEDI